MTASFKRGERVRGRFVGGLPEFVEGTIMEDIEDGFFEVVAIDVSSGPTPEEAMVYWPPERI